MNALMTIQVRVLSAGALARLKAVDAASQKAATSVGGIGRQAQWGLPYLSKWGNQVQWAGRQLIYNFTLPIALAMGMASKFALENEKAMTRVIKVYGDGSKEFKRLAKTEIPALEEAFVALSSRFGVHQQEVIGIAGDWAAAGASGIALAKSVKLTLETMVLGELEAAEATQNLIAIQAQYGQNVTELAKTIDILNMVENQTGASMKGLMDGMARAAGVARTAGVDVEHLAAMMAALTPATGSAASAGNGLKTIISRILSPTQEGVDVMREMNVEVDRMSWQNLTATERLERMAEAFEGLSSAQRVHVSTVLASRWQINRFSQLMRDITNENGYYQRSLEATSDAARIYKQRQFELNKVLESNPQRVKQAWVILQNAAADVIQPLLPTIAYLASELARLASAFANLDPEIQKLVLAGLVVLALIGPLARYVGSLSNLVGLLGAAFLFAARGVGFLASGPLKLLGGMFGAVGTAAGGMVTGVGVATTKAWAFVSKFTMLMLTVPAVIARGMLAIGPLLTRFWITLQASAIVASATIRNVWIAAQLGIVTASRATAVTIQAIWGLMHLNLLKITTGFFARLIAIVGGVAAARFIGIWSVIALAILGILYAFRDQIARIWNDIVQNLQNNAGFQNIVEGWHNVVESIVDAFWALPTGVRDAMLTVLRIVQTIALQVYDWLTYLNPFARHSPSLVESVRSGMDQIEREYARAAGLGSVFKAAARDMALFKKQAVARGGGEFQDERKDVAKSGGNTALFDRMMGHLNKLQPLLARQEQAVNRQQAVVDKWANRLDKANAALDRQQRRLDNLQNRLSEVQAEYDRHEQKLQDFASAPIKGMGKMDDAIFANEMAQKKLRLELLRLNQVNGSVDDLRSRLAALYGDIEELRGRASDLRSMGAGSDVLGPINAQIAAMEAQAAALASSVNNSPAAQIQSELDALSQKGEILDLERSIKFDPMVREIEKLANAQEELSFNQIINGIERQRSAMEALEPTISQLTKKVAEQEGVVARYEAARDKVQQGYDREQAQLDKLQQAYQKTQDVVSNLESALRDMGQTASEALEKAKKAADKAANAKKNAPDIPVGVETFRKGAGANWADPGSNAQIGRLGGLEDQSGMIEDFAQRELDKMNKIFGGFDMFAPIKRWWRSTWAWLKENVGPVVRGVLDTIMAVFSAFPNPFANAGFKKSANTAFDGVKEVVETVFGAIGRIIQLFVPDVIRIWNALKKAGIEAWNKLGPEVAKFGDLIDPIIKLVRDHLWPAIKLVAGVLGGAFFVALKLVAAIISNTVGPALSLVIDVIAGILSVIRGLVKIAVGLLTGDFRLAWEGLVDIVSGVFKAIWGIIKGAWNLIVGVFWGLMKGIKEVWDWLVDILVGHSIIPDLIDTIWKLFKGLVNLGVWVWNEVLKPVIDFFKDLWNDVKDELTKWWERLKIAWSAVKKAGQWFWDEVLKPVITAVKDGWTDVKKEVDEWWTKLKNAWSNITGNIGDWWTNQIWNPVKNKVANAWTDIRTEVSEWWTKLKNAWSNITGNIGDWWMNQIWTPVKNKVSNAWTDIKAEVGDWWERLKNTWSNITGNIGTWWKNNITDPIFNKVTGVWQEIKEWFNKNGDIIKGPVSSVVNTVITAVNAMIRGLNKIADVLPGIDWNIELIPHLASGGDIPQRRVGSGFKTSGARAIVGEGKANYPEYVIPTDPTYRNRARGLVADVGRRIGMVGIPQHASGGILGAIGDAVGSVKDWGKGAWDWAKGKVEAVVSTIFAPFKQMVQSGIEKIDWNYARSAAGSVADQVFDWVTKADKVYEEKAKKQPVAAGAPGGPAVVGGDWERIYWRGHQFNKRTVRMIQDAERIMGQAFHITQGSFSTSVSASGSTHAGGGAFDATSPASISAQNAARQAGFAAWLRTPSQGPWPYHIHGIALGDKQASASAKWQMASYLAGGNGLARGGVVRRRAGGIMARIGEGRHDEAVTPLPRNWRTQAMQSDSGGNRTININGNLEFPNIRNADDAEQFISNLEKLVS